ncbi:MAG: hypothetical protein ACRC2T_14155, partial [Thermoguttaceae bacterium]
TIPLSVGGFYEKDAQGMNGLFRVASKENAKSVTFNCLTGLKLLSPELNDGNMSSLELSIFFGTAKNGNKKNYNRVGDDLVNVYYPKQPDLTSVYTEKSIAEVDTCNAKLADMIYSILQDAHQHFLEADIQLGIELALTEEDRVLYIGGSFPKIEDKINWSLLEKVKLALKDLAVKSELLFRNSERNEKDTSGFIQAKRKFGGLRSRHHVAVNRFISRRNNSFSNYSPNGVRNLRNNLALRHKLLRNNTFQNTPTDEYLIRQELEERLSVFFQGDLSIINIFANSKHLGNIDEIELFGSTINFDDLGLAEEFGGEIYIIIGRSESQFFIAVTQKLDDVTSEEWQEKRDFMFTRLKERINESKRQYADNTAQTTTLFDFSYDSVGIKADDLSRDNRLTHNVICSFDVTPQIKKTGESYCNFNTNLLNYIGSRK